MNRMADVAALFGKKLNEEFTAVIWDETRKCKFTHNGLKIEGIDSWGVSNNWLGCLLTGEAVILDE